MQKFFKFFIALFFFWSAQIAKAQNIIPIQKGNDNDSSYYHLGKIHENEFWAGGEYGILKSFDSIGNVKSLELPTEGYNILKVERVGRFVFITTDDAVLFRYDLTNGSFIKKEFKAFKNRCFYDLLYLGDGNILLCGGTTGISKGKYFIPRGFIAQTDTSLTEPTIKWKSTRKFVWSMAQKENEIYAAIFNGVNTKVVKTTNLKSWESFSKIKGLVHELSLFDNEIYFSGTRSFFYKKRGIFGCVKKRSTNIKSSGCLWSMDIKSNEILAVTEHGQLFKFDMKQNMLQTKTPTDFALYDIERISDNKILVVGHGKTAFIVELTN